MAAPQPLPYYLGAEKSLDAAFQKVLEEASEDAEALIKDLMKRPTFSNRVRAAQIAILRREMLTLTRPMWRELSVRLNLGLDEAAAAAAKYDADVIAPLWERIGIDPESFNRARLLQNYDTVKNYRARTANDIPLSTQVYRTEALADGLVDRQINSGILLGRSAKEIAAGVSGLIAPEVAGGVSYAAYRLGRTELNNAFHAAEIAAREAEPWNEGMKWNLSRSHPKPDKCNEYAEETHQRGGEPGVFPKGSVPKKPHPQCLCYLTSVQYDDDDFISAFYKGEFDDYLRSTVPDGSFSSTSTPDLVRQAQQGASISGISSRRRR